MVRLATNTPDGSPNFDLNHTFRLEPMPRSNEVATGLAARVHDPAWLLTRQWQLGEFAGQDAGSPVLVTLDGRTTPISAWRPRPDVEGEGQGDGQGDGGGPPAWRPYQVGPGPLDARVERERTRPDDRRLRVDGGVQLARMLREQGREALVDTLVRECGFEPTDEPDGSAVGGLSRLLEAAVPDAAAVSRRLKAGPVGPAGAKPVLDAWLRWWQEQTLVQPPVDAFNEHRFEHRFEMACGDVVLRAEEHHAGDPLGMDWYSVDAIDAGAADGVAAPAGAERRFSREALATPVRYGGIPADRFWEMEDAKIDLAATEVATLDLGRLLLIGFAEVYGNDWFVVPVEVPVGAITRLQRLVVTDTFGQGWLVGPAGASDSGWNLFAVTGTDGLLVMPSMPGQTGPELERVTLARDELANTAWAIEHSFTDGAGRLVDRRERSLRTAAPLPEPGEHPTYAVQTVVPPYWLPLVPVSDGPTTESIHFELSTLLQPQVDGREAEPAQALGRLLRAGQWVYEEEVPREGAVLTRRAVVSRWYDGSWHAWTRREKDAGTGESSSGLAFDVVRPSDPWP